MSLLPGLHPAGAASAGAPDSGCIAPSSGDHGALPPTVPGFPHWDERPLALLDGTRLRAVTAGAARARVRAGMTVPEARSRCGALEVLPWDASIVEHEIVRATAALIVASPQVTPVGGAPGLWWVGASGLDGVGGERGLVRTLLRVARLWHPRSRVAVADSCVVARAATWADHGGTAGGITVGGGTAGDGTAGSGTAFIVPRGGCAAYLHPAPLALIPMEDELRQTLHALSLRTAGAFAALDAQDVERRWGAAGMQAWRLAHGDDRRRPVLARPEAERAVSAELATPAPTMEPILFLVRAALDRLVRTLVADGRAAAAVAITLTLDDGRGALPAGGVAHTVTRELRPARPLARVAPLFERCRALLADWPLHAPVSGVTVRIAATAPNSAEQGDLLASAWRDPAAAEAALERLRAELGPNVVVRPVLRDSHVPDRAGAWVELTDGTATDDAPVTGRGRRAGTGAGSVGTAGARAEAEAGTGTAEGGAVTGAWPAPASPANRGAPPELHDTPTNPAPPHRTPATGTGTTPIHLSTGGPETRPSIPPSPLTPNPSHLASNPSHLALRLLEPPEPVVLDWDAGAPRTLWWRGRGIAVQRADGPERLAGDWWAEPYRRDYWRCTASDGEFLVYRDILDGGARAATPQWYLQGWYD